MEIPRNLISDSTLVQDTFDLLTANDGRAAFTEIADVVFRLSHAGEELAALLVADLIRNDPRFRIEAAHLAIVDDDTELRWLNEIDFVVLDVEAIVARTQPARIIELGAYRVRGGQIRDDFRTLINPEARLPRFIATMTGISDEMLAAAPKFAEVVGAWLAFAGDAVLVAHNSSFDLPLLNREIARVFPGYGLRNHELCTVNLARHLVLNSDGHNLDALADHFGIENPERHRAAGDALTTARILLYLLDQLEAGGVRTLAAARTFRANADTPGAELNLQLTLDI
jgi:DNA polymerase III epsilon subunit family exonuclease